MPCLFVDQMHAAIDGSAGPSSTVGKFKDKNFQGASYTRERRAKSQYYGKVPPPAIALGFCFYTNAGFSIVWDKLKLVKDNISVIFI